MPYCKTIFFWWKLIAAAVQRIMMIDWYEYDIFSKGVKLVEQPNT